MDKNTLSNYGWIVIAVLVLAVMIALATPFGKYIESGVRSTTAGLFETSEKAMNVVGMTAGERNFEDGYQGGDSGESSRPVQLTTLTPKTWNGLTNFSRSNIWTDGTNIYHSFTSKQYVLNGDTWEHKTWNGLTSFNGSHVWTDGTNYYYSINKEHYVFS